MTKPSVQTTKPSVQTLRYALILTCAIAVAASWQTNGADAPLTGEEIYREQCTRCHGHNGEGVADKYDEPLFGDRSVESLAKLISRTMPEDRDKKCAGEEAAKVARYIYDAFYSPQARARVNPPKIQLSRLTVRQHQNTVADLFGTFRTGNSLGERRGLEGQYYNARNFNGDKKAFERLDGRIEFNFGEATPDPEKLTTNEFAIRWRGSVIAEETGPYEFILKTENSARLWVNSHDRNKTLIDAWVSSGTDVKEHRETIFLLGGRAYPLQLDYFKFKDKTASIALEWKPPHGVRETIPARNLAPTRIAETTVVRTAFPPDDSSVGYERGTAVSKAWDQATTCAAIEIANKVVEQMETITGVKAKGEERPEQLKRFCERFAERAFRRPLADEQKGFFIQKLAARRRMIMTLLRGDGDSHMRGMSCLLTGIELFPGNIQGGSHTPAGWASGISIDQEMRNFFQSRTDTRTRFGSLEFGVAVPHRADPWTRMSYAGPNKPVAPIDDPYQMFEKLYGRVKDKESLKSILDDVREDLTRVTKQVSNEDKKLLEEHLTFVRDMERELQTSDQQALPHPGPELDAGVINENDNIPRISRMQIDMLVNSFRNDMTRVATLP